MGIFSKFSTLIKSNINDLINRAENPEKMLNQIILDMRDQLAKAKREHGSYISGPMGTLYISVIRAENLIGVQNSHVICY